MRRRYLTSIAIGIAVLWFRRRRYLTSIAIGIAVLWFSQWAWLEGSGHIYNMSPNRSDIWYGAMVSILFALSLVIPGFCAGWISRRHGILLGALTGLIGGITYTTLLSPVLHHHTSVLRFFTSGTILVAFWSSQFGRRLRVQPVVLRVSCCVLTIAGGDREGFCVRAAGAEEIVRPRRLIGRSWAAPQLHR